jgi:uncharacterized SAM-binding protein YcdF (DUF218 family)
VFAVVLQVAALVSLFAASAQGHRLEGRRRKLLWMLPPVLLLGSLVATGDAFVLRKWLGRIAMPVSWFFVASIAASVWAWRARRPRLAWIATGVTSIYAAVGNPWLGNALVGSLEAPYVAAPDIGAGDASQHFDAVAVLGGGTSQTPDGRPQLSASGDRIAVAARLYHEGRTPRLLCTGSAVAGYHRSGATNLGRDTVALLVGMGVPESAIVPIGGPTSTREEIAVLAALADKEGYARFGLVTSAWHLPRAMRSAERLGMSAVPIPADFKSGPPMVTIVHLWPGIDGFAGVRTFAWERLGMAMGR